MNAQIVVFSRKTDVQRKKNFAFRSAKILRMETLKLILLLSFSSYWYNPEIVYSLESGY